MILDIITHPHPTLRKKSHEISHEEILNPEFKKFIQDLGQTMIKKDGIGLAAPQVNQLIRAIVVNINNMPVPLLNPQILKKSWRKNVMEEGCLSVPGIHGSVKRATAITLKYTDLNNHQHQLKAKNILARVIQHEVDHLDGVLFIDRF